ncbi:methionyl-tRNA formyltransferase [candidate division WOR-1 bacterium RIFOXYD2_FULL_36_8]|uniref:Methionyl-tRNA formyltransferase n=1 Tax=candidate division WOR-1 bacterium RIFOXYB2_FULL_36_35 TaxID=1802578 RepID=A0A1F4S800_UNCSA|nr:MAG: methionyl-tRNA formyltransferase [candidate division WOR-1 bacterium RIFOXYA2_FULL_36_21]OGC16544.1 MAG: methionyl-tRNA formyltransferase [candidate division WOR-1 bacterium RIFOXYB2_FULL_36_35]OGC16882.1 MAG: methionyl-tRNA formyltransferase [candidate division WOR-1 bacterium RIFOXYA12_FULL_36_13]OGC38725.1 MAG: methionyl-tRNA formyltransferase [candidate division WOR-1 bacterium RIFOXYD2_FULL_36_8]
MKIIFFGTPSPAAVCLKMLLNIQEEVVYVISQPDRKKGRGQTISSAPVKEVAIQNDIPVETPGKIQDKLFIEKIKYLKPDLIIVVAYGKILPKEILEIPKHGAINLHASLLPKYRGAAPIQYALLNGEKETGITIMQLDEGLDTGEIILQETLEIKLEDTSETLSNKLFARGGLLLLTAIKQIENNTTKKRAQDNSKATYTKLITKEMGKIDWNKQAEEINNQIRALTPWPSAYTFIDGKMLKVFKAEIVAISEIKKPGEIIKSKDKLIVACGKDALLIKELQIEGKHKMFTEDFLKGYGMKLPSTFY